jgi:long-chain acyl-CoA synthetase
MSSDSVLAERTEIDATIQGKTLCDLVARNAQAYADQPAMSWKEGGSWRSLSWAEVRERVAEVAMGLGVLGVSRGDFVAIMARSRPEHLIADMGAVHAGATPVSLYNTLASEQIAYIASHCQARVAVVEDREFLQRWEKAKPELPRLEHVVLLEDAKGSADLDWVLSWGDLASRGRDALAADRAGFEASWRAVQPEDLATVVYTSGTTGPPKGVMLTHRNELWMCESVSRAAEFDVGIRGIFYLPLAHAFARTANHYLGIYKAGHGFLCPDLLKVFEVAAEVHPEAFNAVPRVWEKLQAGILAEVAAEANPRRRIAERAIQVGRKTARLEQTQRPLPLGLRLQRAMFDRLVCSKVREKIGLDRCEFAVTGAAPISPELLEFFWGLGVKIHEGYGMTECTVGSHLNPRHQIRIGTVGPALPGVEARLAKDGEVLVRGGNVAAGYYKDPEQTAQTFDADGWLHTGDIGQLSPDGWLRIVDRKKELIITAGGKNISPANLESLLKRHPLVGQAFAYGDRRPYVVALVVLDGEVAPGWAHANQVPFSSLQAFAAEPRVHAEIQRAVEAANRQVSRVEQIKRFGILPAEWTVDSAELTPTLKLKRRVIQHKYAKELEALYE